MDKELNHPLYTVEDCLGIIRNNFSGYMRIISESDDDNFHTVFITRGGDEVPVSSGEQYYIASGEKFRTALLRLTVEALRKEGGG